jgi:phosphoglycolate phosphatase
MADSAPITLACFGLLGTLVTDGGLIERAYTEAIAIQGVVAGTSAYARSMAQVHRSRGQAPAAVLTSLFPENQPRAQAALLTYERSLADALARTPPVPVPGAGEVLANLAAAGCRVCVLTTVPRRLATAIVRAAGWRDRIKVMLTVDDVPRGCPAPDLALAAMLRAGVADVREMAMVEATGPGVECGRRAGGSVVAGVLTGPHAAARLARSGATHVIDSVAELPEVLAEVSRSALSAEPPATPRANLLNRAHVANQRSRR